MAVLQAQVRAGNFCLALPAWVGLDIRADCGIEMTDLGMPTSVCVCNACAVRLDQSIPHCREKKEAHLRCVLLNELRVLYRYLMDLLHTVQAFLMVFYLNFVIGLECLQETLEINWWLYFGLLEFVAYSVLQRIEYLVDPNGPVFSRNLKPRRIHLEGF